jgi:hypothetical protein
MKDGNLAALVNHIQKATLEHWNYDTFRAHYDKKWYDKSYLSFRLDTGGKVAELVFDGITLKKVENK